MNRSKPTYHERVKTIMSQLLTLFCRQAAFLSSIEAYIPTHIVYLIDSTFVIETMSKPSR